LEIIWRRPTCHIPLPPPVPACWGAEAAWLPHAAMLPRAAATCACTRVKDCSGPRSGAAQWSDATCASTSASPHCPHLADSRRSASRVAPLPVVEAIVELVRSLIALLPHFHCEPFHRAECSAVMLLPSHRHRLSMRATVAHLVLLPLHAGFAAPMLEAKPCRPSPVMRPLELCRCCSSSGEPRADRHRERCRGHPRRWVTPAIPRPN
jgi:hypothetical protein